jgi:chemotaxis protein histidine kinase CheA
LRFLELPDDPDAAFRVRAAADRTELTRLAQSLHGRNTISRDDDVLATLEELAHGLAGTGGVFGFPGVSTAAEKLERLAERQMRAKAAPLTPQQVTRLASSAAALIEQLNRVPPPKDTA